ncbi:tropomodulin-1 [Lingula anatina]|uniref:Tropomodulin-1 n=1 Tax=Lingula anatina TaxID=7574 RepID=A0A1S3JDY0_LINAN|nr:tropomodulin-1 [Lingula anatina]|eukprot:XP_013408538.1 tropomodulin-1 [Lingula anatina]
MSSKLFGKDLKQYEDLDIDELLEKLTPEELEELNNDIDPDNSLLPPSQRCKDQTTKAPTGPFKRQQLLDFLEKKAKEEKDWEQNKPYVKETRGKVYVPKEEPKKIDPNDEIETEFDDILRSATEEELVDLAAVLGFHSLLNQVQYTASMEDRKVEGGFSGMAKAQLLKKVEDEPPNDTDVDEALQQIKSNDPKLKELNLNNIKNISIERLCEFAQALKTNTNLEHFHMANTAASDKVGRELAEAMKENKTLKTLNIESNFISGPVIVEIIEAINQPQTLLEFRVENQKPQVLGCKVEMEVAKLIESNDTLIKLGMTLEFANARIRISEKIEKNLDKYRLERVGDKEKK